jgi:hypothetical protein
LKKIDISILKEFLEHSGCGLYFLREPFIVAGVTARINDIEDSTLIRWVEEYNSHHATTVASDSADDNTPPWGTNKEDSNETD